MGTVRFGDVYLGGSSATVGKKEMAGPLREWFDLHEENEYFGMPTFEQAESEMVRRNLAQLFEKAHIQNAGVLLGGDLLNQCTGTSFGIKESKMPFLGLYGACSTIAEGLLVGSMLVNGGYFSTAVAMASSHFCTAERQYRAPIEYGGQRAPTAQWTVTGAGAFLLGSGGRVRIKRALPGVVVEKGAVIRNCVLFKETTVRAGAKISYVIADKDVEILENRTLMGHATYPIVLFKGTKV
jgi:stage V sporulation protein AD